MASRDGTLREMLVLGAGAAVAAGLAWSHRRRSDALAEEMPVYKEAGMVFGRGFVDEAAFGIVDPVTDRFVLTPAEVKAWEARRKRHKVANVTGRGAGFATSLLYGGEVAKGAQVAGKGVLAARAGLLAGRAAEGAAVKGAERAALRAAEGAAEKAALRAGEEAAEKAAVSVAKEAPKPKSVFQKIAKVMLGRTVGESAVTAGLQKVPTSVAEIAQAKIREGAGAVFGSLGQGMGDSFVGQMYQLAIERARERSKLMEDAEEEVEP